VSRGCRLELSGILVETLKRRARDFMELAEDMMKRSKYDLAAFFAEQSCQLYLKAVLIKLFGEAPAVHGLRQLLGVLARKLEENRRGDIAQSILNFVKEHRDELSDLEEAYTGARYRVLEFTENQVAAMIESAKKLLKLLEEVERNVMG